MEATVSEQMRSLVATIGPFESWATSPRLVRGLRRPDACDFLFGNPHDMAPAAYVDTLARATRPNGPDHYAYTMDLSSATNAVAEGLRDRFGLPFEPDDIHMTNGNFAGLSIALRAVADPGDEVLFVSPPWFFYEMLILASGATPVRVLADRSTFDLDVDAIARSLTSRTRAVIVNSPNNPTGRIYPPATLDALAAVLRDASDRNGRPIFLLSDEAYSHILFDGRAFPTPVAHYPWSFLIYTYAKTLLSPGSRLGYVALPPGMPSRRDMGRVLTVARMATGWAFPVATLQRAVPDLERQDADLDTLQRRRDVLVGALREQGYDLVDPEGTFYLLVRSPLEDDLAFAELLSAHDVYVLPGAMFEMPGWFRISMTASDAMIDRALPGFAKAVVEARASRRGASG